MDTTDKNFSELTNDIRGIAQELQTIYSQAEIHSINPQATAEYIQSYKEMYDADENLSKSGYFKNNPIE